MTNSTSDRYRPVLAIEVDGLLAIPKTSTRDERFDWFEREITVQRDTYPEETRGEPQWDSEGNWTTEYALNRTAADWVNRLLRRGVEVVWASTWREHANTYFAPHLGLPPLASALPEGHWSGPTIGDAKVRQIARLFDGRPLLLVSDMPPIAGGESLAQLRRPVDRAVTRLVSYPWGRTFDSDDLTDIDWWLRLAETATGHEELRRRRRRTLDRLRRMRSRRESGTPAGGSGRAGHGRNEGTDRKIEIVDAIVDRVHDQLVSMNDVGVDLAALGDPTDLAEALATAILERLAGRPRPSTEPAHPKADQGAAPESAER